MKNQEIIMERTKELLSVHCYEGLKEAAEQWLNAVGTEREAEASRKYVSALEDAVTDIDTVINLFGSDMAKEKFGTDMANKIHSHALEIKAKGAKWCDCPACTAGLKVLEYKADLLGE
jgi:NAD dependent epimerase/dehydratase family enzyme